MCLFSDLYNNNRSGSDYRTNGKRAQGRQKFTYTNKCIAIPQNKTTTTTTTTKDIFASSLHCVWLGVIRPLR